MLYQAVKGISDLITIHGLVNLDFADVRTIMTGQGMALMGTGLASGEKRSLEAASRAISSPLLEDISIDGAKGILINITGSSNLTLHEINEASMLVQEAAHEDANIIFGAVIDEEMGDTIRVTVIATGFLEKEKVERKEPVRAPERIERVTPPTSQPNVGTHVHHEADWDRGTTARPRYTTVATNWQTNKVQPRYTHDDDYEIPTFLRKQVD